MNKNITLVLGICGSGKTTFCNILKKDFSIIRVNDCLDEILKQKEKPINDLTKRNLRNKLKNLYGPEALAYICIDRINEQKNKNIIIDGIYTLEEYNYLKKIYKKINLISVLTNQELRYKRLENRKDRFLKKENIIKRDLHEINDLDKSKLIVIANYFITNNSTKKAFKEKIEKWKKQFVQAGKSIL